MSVCLCCGKSFVPAWNHPSQKFCTRICQCKGYYDSHQNKILEYAKDYHQTTRGKEVLRRACKKYREIHKKSPMKDIEKKCVFCGETFMVDPFHPHAKYCSKKCYWKSDEGKNVLRKYYHSGGKDVMMNYRKTPNGKKILLDADKKYRESFKRKEYLEQYHQTPKGYESMRKADKKCKSKRRGYGFIELMPNVFPDDIDIDFHHLLNDFHSDDRQSWFVVPLPRITHTYIGGFTSGREHWRFCADWITKVFCLDVKGFLGGLLCQGE